MTLGDLIKKARDIGNMFNTYQVPLVNELWVEFQDIQFEAKQDTDNKWYIQMTVK